MSLTSDEKDALVARLRGHLDNAGVCAIELHPAIYDDAFESVRRVLAPHLPAEAEVEENGPLVVRLRGDAGAVEAVAHLLGS